MASAMDEDSEARIVAVPCERLQRDLTLERKGAETLTDEDARMEAKG